VAGNAQDAAGINLPVDSQTLYTRIARKTTVNGGPQMRDGVLIPGLLSVALYPCSARYWSLSVPAGPCLPGPVRACGQVRAGVRGGWRAARADAGKAAGTAGKARVRTVINSGAVSDGMRGN
jgi:hypothetical protein